MPNNNVKPPLGQVQERFDIKGGINRDNQSHLNPPNTWWDVLNFRFYKQNIFTFFRKALYSVVVPTAQTLTIPTQTCSVNASETIIPFGMWGYGAGGGPGGFDPIPPTPPPSFILHAALSITETADNPASFEYSIDGASYQTLSSPVSVTATTQLKLRVTATPGTYSVFGGANIIGCTLTAPTALNYAAGSVCAINGSVVTVPPVSNCVTCDEPLFGHPQSAFVNNFDGVFSFSQNLTGIIPLGSLISVGFGNAYGTTYDYTSCVLEAVINLV